MDSSQLKKVIIIRLPSDEEMQEELEEIIYVKIPAAYRDALKQLSKLAGIQMKDAVVNGLKLFFEELNKKA